MHLQLLIKSTDEAGTSKISLQSISQNNIDTTTTIFIICRSLQQPHKRYFHTPIHSHEMKHSNIEKNSDHTIINKPNMKLNFAKVIAQEILPPRLGIRP